MKYSEEIIGCYNSLVGRESIKRGINKLENELGEWNTKVNEAKANLIAALSENEYEKSHIFEFDIHYLVMLYDTGDYIAQIVEK